MPKTVSDLETSLAAYVHPDLEFMDVLNEVLPQLASRGIWKHLTFEESIALADTDRFFSLPEAADSVLYALSDNAPVPVKPLWNAYVNAGATSGRIGGQYGVEDAGSTPTKELLSAEFYYALVVLPDYDYGGVASGNRVTAPALSATDSLTIEYVDLQGVAASVTFSPAASAAAQHIPTRPVKSITSIRHSGFAVPCRILAVPIRHYGTFSVPGVGNIGSLAAWGTYPTAYTTLFPTPGLSGALLYDAATGARVDDSVSFVPSTVTASAASGTSYTGTAGTWDVYGFDTSWLSNVFYKTGDVSVGIKTMAIVEGDGVTEYRQFRQQDLGSTVHLLLRRRIPKYESSDSLVYVDNVSALKYAILANTAEFNNDLTQARSWWDEAERELDAELSKYLGAAQPQIIFDPSGGQGTIESIQ